MYTNDEVAIASGIISLVNGNKPKKATDTKKSVIENFVFCAV